MPPRIHVWPEAPETRGDRDRLRAVVEIPARHLAPLRRARRHEVVVDRPGLDGISREPDAAPFALAVLFVGMRRGRDLVVHGALPAAWRANLALLVEAWRAWVPGRYRTIAVEAERWEEEPVAAGPSLLAYSGGLDSVHAALELAEAGRLGGGLFVHGADIPADDAEGFERAARRVGVLFEALGVPLHRAVTDVRRMGTFWMDANRVVLAGVLRSLRGAFASGQLAASYDRQIAARLWPMERIDTELVSTPGFLLDLEGAETGRPAKMARVVRHPVALAGLRVCFESPQVDVNCGRCEKCLTTMLMASACGADPAPCFPRGPTLEDVDRLTAAPSAQLAVRLLEIDAFAREVGCDARWVDRLARRLPPAPTRPLVGL